MVCHGFCLRQGTTRPKPIRTVLRMKTTTQKEFTLKYELGNKYIGHLHHRAMHICIIGQGRAKKNVYSTIYTPHRFLHDTFDLALYVSPHCCCLHTYHTPQKKRSRMGFWVFRGEMGQRNGKYRISSSWCRLFLLHAAHAVQNMKCHSNAMNMGAYVDSVQ